MKQPEWPGIATAVGLVLILTVVIVVYQNWNLDALRQWQTLLAAGIALVAAGIAWLSATLKLSFDKQQVATDRRRKRLATLYRADLALKDIRDKCWGAKDRIDEAARSPLPTASLNKWDIEIIEPVEFELMWDDLDVFPRSLITRLANIRRSVRAAAWLVHDEFPISGRATLSPQYGPQIGQLYSECGKAIDELKPLISDLINEV
jgi:hypothetical protein